MYTDAGTGWSAPESEPKNHCQIKYSRRLPDAVSPIPVTPALSNHKNKHTAQQKCHCRQYAITDKGKRISQIIKNTLCQLYHTILHQFPTHSLILTI
jgi:hypothetical protein